MSNSRTCSINYTPSMTQMEAFDKLHPKIRAALRELVTEYDTVAIYRHWQRVGDPKRTIAWVRSGEAGDLKRPWYRGFPNPIVTLRLRPLRPRY